MKKTTEHGRHNDMRAEFDFASLKSGVRGKYYEQYRKATNVVALDADVAAASPTEAAVKEALRAILTMTRGMRRTAGSPDRAATTSNGASKRRSFRK